MLVITDSQVPNGCGMKGRSSSPSLLRLLRVLAAHILATGSFLYMRWIPSLRNHADGPSRGQGIG